MPGSALVFQVPNDYRRGASVSCGILGSRGAGVVRVVDASRHPCASRIPCASCKRSVSRLYGTSRRICCVGGGSAPSRETGVSRDFGASRPLSYRRVRSAASRELRVFRNQSASRNVHGARICSAKEGLWQP
jgi:hypothetical protein